MKSWPSSTRLFNIPRDENGSIRAAEWSPRFVSKKWTCAPAPKAKPATFFHEKTCHFSPERATDGSIRVFFSDLSTWQTSSQKWTKVRRSHFKKEKNLTLFVTSDKIWAFKAKNQTFGKISATVILTASYNLTFLMRLVMMLIMNVIKKHTSRDERG